jgi:uncharacterized membrane protein YkoI
MVDTKKLLASAAIAAVLTLGAGTAVVAQQGALPGQEDEAPGRDDEATEKPITGSSLEQASQVALTHVGGGEVTDTEVGDEEGFYEVEVTRADGSQVDVHLDRGFDVLGAEGDATEDGS